MTTETVIRLELRGGNAEAWDAREPEILLEGPRGTGKTRTWLELINQLCHHFDGLQVLITRKYAVTLASTCLKTFNEQVKRPGDGVAYFGGSDIEPSSYRYPNGSRITVGGLDNPKARDKMLSAEYDLVYVNELPELTEDDLVALKATLRHARPDGTPIITARRIVADCNPANRGNWVNLRCERGQMRRIRTTLRDNPRFAHPNGEWTVEGETYLRDNLPPPGTRRYDSWVLGLWSGAENAVYPFDRVTHVRPLEEGLHFKANIIWVDYGSRHICSVGCLGIDQFNRAWMRGCWGKPDTDQGEMLVRVVGEFKQKFNTSRGRVDPNQAFLAGRFGFNVAKGGGGGSAGPPRLHRVDLLEPLFNMWPGGYVPTFTEDKRQDVLIPRRDGNDTPGFFVVEGCEGSEEFIDQIEAYHYIYTETPRGVVKDIYRDNEDHIAGIEYAYEEWVEGDVIDYAANGPPVALGVRYEMAEAPVKVNPWLKKRPQPREENVRVG